MPSGIGVFNHSGSLVICFFFPFGPTNAVFSAYASDGSSWRPPTKSENDGPVLSLSENEVGLMRGLSSGESWVGAFGAAVANERYLGIVDRGAFRALRNVEHCTHTYLGLVDILARAEKVCREKDVLDQEV